MISQAIVVSHHLWGGGVVKLYHLCKGHYSTEIVGHSSAVIRSDREYFNLLSLCFMH